LALKSAKQLVSGGKQIIPFCAVSWMESSQKALKIAAAAPSVGLA
jgi:hypothetical protein